ncbi:MAG: ABC transporter substrate-binding protein [Synergistaceae bacterium]|nr:ABC transporter substrate-binding protein [Synergistaceae bacterium]
MRRNTIIKIIILAAFLIPVFALSSWTAEKKILRYGAIPQKINLDMYLNTINDVMGISDHIIETLVRYDDDMVLRPLLIKELPVPSKGGLVYRFELKPGIKFHDGSPLTVSDVKFSIEHMFYPSTGAAMNWVCDMIVGAKDMMDGKSNELSGFKIIDDLTFEITLEYPYAPFLSALATSYTGIYPEKAFKEAGKDWGLKTFLGTGPFKVTVLDIDTGVITERFEDYHGEKPKLDGIEFIFIDDTNTRIMEYERGNLDVVELPATLYPEYSKDDRFASQIGEFTPMGTIFICPNNSVPELGSAKVREALSYAVDREMLARDLMKGTAKPATTFLTPGMMGYNKDAPAYEYNIEKAKILLAEAGFPDGFSVEGIIRNTHMSTQAGRTLLALQNQLKSIGVDLTITQVDSATWVEMRAANKIQLYIGTWYADFPDPDGFVYSLLHSSNSPRLSSSYNSPEFDRLLDEARAISDNEKRDEMYRQADNLATRVDYAVIPLYNETLYYMAKPYVKNFKMSPVYIFHFFNADIEK